MSYYGTPESKNFEQRGSSHKSVLIDCCKPLMSGIGYHTYIVVVGNTQKVKSALYPQDLAAATQNILLAATALNLGSCWLGIHTHDDRAKSLIDTLALPEHIVPFSVIAIGQPEDPNALKPIDRYQPEVVHYNRW